MEALGAEGAVGVEVNRDAGAIREETGGAETVSEEGGWALRQPLWR